jgi:hypothetical protein
MFCFQPALEIAKRSCIVTRLVLDTIAETISEVGITASHRDLRMDKTAHW